jgi:formylglycine-generating enzyme required for sulfatase activity
VGSGGVETSSFTTANSTSGATVPFQITSTAPTIQGNNAGSSASNLSARGSLDLTGTTTAALETGYPTGYNAFYSMKYEISQQQYVDFLNNLTQTQATARKFNSSSFRYAITGTTIENYATTNPFLACNMLAWTDISGYLDWSGLRPMTELEFEKACRGTGSAVANEYAWGTTGIVGLAYTLSNSDANDEAIATNYNTLNPTIGNALYTTTIGSIGGPLRVGIFAGTFRNNGRVTSGATYYGIMEMSGNLWEICVTVGNLAGRAFIGTHGNGAIATNGNADATTWPDINATGSSLRGGGINSSNVLLPVSDRSVGTQN